MRKFTSQEIKEFVSKPLFDEKIILNKDPSWPKISIVTISFNQGKFLRIAINSVISQNYPNIEYIVVDPGSTDSSREIIKKYENKIDYIIFDKDKGPADGLNKGFSRATGEIFGYINADDYLLPGALTIIGEYFARNPDVDIVSGYGFIVDERGNIISRVLPTRFTPLKYAYGLVRFFQQATFFRRDMFFKVGGFNINNHTCWDAELMVDMALVGAKHSVINMPVAAFRLHRDSISGSGRKYKEYLDDKERILYKILKRKQSSLEKIFIKMIVSPFFLISHPYLLFESIRFKINKIYYGY